MTYPAWRKRRVRRHRRRYVRRWREALRLLVFALVMRARGEALRAARWARMLHPGGRILTYTLNVRGLL